MEVHHAHHPAHKKKISEYFLEFFMLFFAVTLGFFAENQREHYIESLREKQYMESFLEDIAKDKIEIAATRNFTTTQISYLDTAINILSSNQLTPQNIILLYRSSLKTGGNRPITFIDRTSAQLRSGGMRLIKDKKVATLISEYWQLIAQLNDFNTVTITNYKTNIKNMTYKIFDGTNYVDPKTKSIKKGATLMMYDPILLKEYNNRLLNLKYDLYNFSMLYFYKELDKKIDMLQKEISAAYHIKSL
jgi:hypothetical protein